MPKIEHLAPSTPDRGPDGVMVDVSETASAVRPQ